MDTKDYSAKERIFNTALKLIEEGQGLQNITSRQIAEKAGVNLALINYYYQSKENLLSQAVAGKMDNIIRQVYERSDLNGDPVAKLKNLLITSAEFAFKYLETWRIAAQSDIKSACRSSNEMIMPLLREIIKDGTEDELKMTALQLILPFYNIVLYTDTYNEYLKTDCFASEKRAAKISEMIDNILRAKK